MGFSPRSFIHDFDFDVSGLGGEYALVMDLYTYEPDDSKPIYFAPFSHNAAHNPIPEPSTMLLLGSGLLGLAGIGVRKKRKI